MDGYTVSQLQESHCSVLRAASYQNECAWKTAATTCCSTTLPGKYYCNYDTCLQNEYSNHVGTLKCNPTLP